MDLDKKLGKLLAQSEQDILKNRRIQSQGYKYDIRIVEIENFMISQFVKIRDEKPDFYKVDTMWRTACDMCKKGDPYKIADTDVYLQVMSLIINDIQEFIKMNHNISGLRLDKKDPIIRNIVKSAYQLIKNTSCFIQICNVERPENDENFKLVIDEIADHYTKGRKKILSHLKRCQNINTLTKVLDILYYKSPSKIGIVIERLIDIHDRIENVSKKNLIARYIIKYHDHVPIKLTKDTASIIEAYIISINDIDELKALVNENETLKPFRKILIKHAKKISTHTNVKPNSAAICAILGI